MGIHGSMGIRTTAEQAAAAAEWLAQHRPAAAEQLRRDRAARAATAAVSAEHRLRREGREEALAGKRIAAEVLGRYHAEYRAGYREGTELARHSEELAAALGALAWESEKGAWVAEEGALAYVVEPRQSPAHAGCRWVGLRINTLSGRVVRLAESMTAEGAMVACGRDHLGTR